MTREANILRPDNDFLTLDLTRSWQSASPALNNLPSPSGPPSVANGYLWSSFQSLFLYGGEFSDNPIDPPTPLSLWEYAIGSSSWQQFTNPQTSSGPNAPDGNIAVQRVAEGAGVSVPGLGRGWFWGGHEDPFTTSSWPQSVPRTYLNALLEYAFPDPGSPAGAWQNVTGTNGSPDADGVLLYVPGFGADGILVALAGGASDTFASLTTVNVFDIATSNWYEQGTTGTTPQSRVNPCAVVAAAADGSSYNIYLYGGQNLQPSGSQTQYTDMWILTIPAFVWIRVDASQNSPVARAGHTCDVWDGQMVVVGGYLGDSSTCDASPTYVFNMSSLSWSQGFTRMSDARANPLSLQDAQLANTTGPNAALHGSYGYAVPDPVQSIVGGHVSGEATITAPVAAATVGPLATGGPRMYTVTQHAASATETATIDRGSGGGSDKTATIVGAVVGSIAGVILILGIYAAYCAVLYKRRLTMYQQHMEAERAQREKDGAATTLMNGSSSENTGRVPSRPGIGGRRGRRSSEDLLGNMEPSFIGIMMHPRRSLRVVNR